MPITPGAFQEAKVRRLLEFRSLRQDKIKTKLNKQKNPKSHTTTKIPHMVVGELFALPVLLCQ